MVSLGDNNIACTVYIGRKIIHGLVWSDWGFEDWMEEVVKDWLRKSRGGAYLAM